MTAAPWRLEFTKWDGAAHWHFELEALGRDEHGAWFGARAGAVLQRGVEPPIRWPCDFLILWPRSGDYVVTFNASGKYPVYVDVTGPVTASDRRLRAIDLDLDVVRTATGEVRLLDEDEFGAHQVRYGYPREVIRTARATAGALLEWVAARREPFGLAPERWFALLNPKPGCGVGREQPAADR
jgi:hypothetical protein